MRVAVVLTARPSWAKLEPVCRALMQRPDVELQIIACASALLERYGRVVDHVRAEGYAVVDEVWSVYEGATVQTSAYETGALCTALAASLSRLRPDTVVVCADRHEVLGAAQAAAYQHLRLIHLQGGERTGSIDDKVRDSITQLSDVHCVTTQRAKFRVYSLTGSSQVYQTGCPSIDLAKQALDDPPVTTDELGGAGLDIDLAQPFVVVLYHPVTDEGSQAEKLDAIVLSAVTHAPQVLCLWPGQDAGAEQISKALRGWQEHVHTVRNLPPARFLKLLTQASCLLGNSSAGIREASYLGVPVVNVGTRQWGRERASNVIDVPHDGFQIAEALKWQLARGRYPGSTLYGSGTAGEQIAEVICTQTTSGSAHVWPGRSSA